MTPALRGPLKDVTFVIPLRIDSPERARNVSLVVAYLTTALGARVVVTELDCAPRFRGHTTRVSSQVLGPDALFDYRFVKDERGDGVFHRTKILNTMILESRTPIVVNYDADVVLPVQSYHAAAAALRDDTLDVVFPFSFGPGVQRRVFLTRAAEDEFVRSGYSLDALESVSVLERAEFGFCQFFRRQAYAAGYLENENFVSYGPEDIERHHRFSRLGYRVGRIAAPIYHLEHPRTRNSSPANPLMTWNMRLWRRLEAMSPADLRRYYERQPYLRARDGLVLSDRVLR
jgi:hypothetical protein